ncbi:triacylglycerol lipase 2-like [Impatiens glandulifera]|uniref:triacylglycerol lipase 2-like n=1 Tax=Impatiens glandulifera TaxID=253017 RepID=UPI001FB0FA2A|nr:triacylglycerol lipase 2-like [Impatiens glandulifera]
MTKIALLVLPILIILSTTTNGARTRLLFHGGLSGEGNNGICNSMVLPQGYPCQDHKVTTEDGFILGIQRIPTGSSGNPSDKPPVLLQHGLMMDAGTWLLNQPDESLAFILADEGYDVWMANTRGTNSSLGHTSLNPQDQEFWDWTWDELVTYDLPTTIQYVHDQTGQNLHYVGHSLVKNMFFLLHLKPNSDLMIGFGILKGTLIALAAFSQGELLNMIRSVVLLSPIAYLSQMPSPLGKAAANNFIAEVSDLYWLGIHEFAPGGGPTGQNCCLNSSRTGYFLDHEPQATSTKNMIHVSQMIRGGKIAMFDYGSDKENLKHYGQTNPPEYNMSRIPNDIPLYLSYGGQDALSDVNDVQTLLASLENHEPDKLVTQYQDDYAHADFVFGVNAKEVVYDPVVAFFELN